MSVAPLAAGLVVVGESVGANAVERTAIDQIARKSNKKKMRVCLII
jgi:hypothetical protein